MATVYIHVCIHRRVPYAYGPDTRTKYGRSQRFLFPKTRECFFPDSPYSAERNRKKNPRNLESPAADSGPFCFSPQRLSAREKFLPHPHRIRVLPIGIRVYWCTQLEFDWSFSDGAFRRRRRSYAGIDHRASQQEIRVCFRFLEIRASSSSPPHDSWKLPRVSQN
jgi:hypothetical protein